MKCDNCQSSKPLKNTIRHGQIISLCHDCFDKNKKSPVLLSTDVESKDDLHIKAPLVYASKSVITEGTIDIHAESNIMPIIAANTIGGNMVNLEAKGGVMSIIDVNQIVAGQGGASVKASGEHAAIFLTKGVDSLSSVSLESTSSNPKVGGSIKVGQVTAAKGVKICGTGKVMADSISAGQDGIFITGKNINTKDIKSDGSVFAVATDGSPEAKAIMDAFMFKIKK